MEESQRKLLHRFIDSEGYNKLCEFHKDNEAIEKFLERTRLAVVKSFDSYNDPYDKNSCNVIYMNEQDLQFLFKLWCSLVLTRPIVDLEKYHIIYMIKRNLYLRTPIGDLVCLESESWSSVDKESNMFIKYEIGYEKR